MRASPLPLLLLVAACSGQIGDTLPGDGTANPNSPSACQADARYADSAPVRRLSQTELANTLRALAGELGVSSFDPGASPLPNPTPGNWFSNNLETNSVSQLTSEQLVASAERASEQLTANANQLTGCTLSSTADTCVRAFIERFGRIALRRPLESDETDRLAALYTAIASQDTTRSGVRAIIEATLQSPDFLYITARATAGTDGRNRFDGHTVARRLSYFLWSTMPDAELRDAADAGELATTEGIRTQVQRMLDDDRARDMLRRFHREWLGIRDPGGMVKDTTIFPNFSPALAADMVAELEYFVDDVAWTRAESIANLLTDRSAMVNSRLAEFYGVDADSADASDWQPVTLPQNRRGILTRAAYLASNATETGTSPIKRGAAVLSKLLCVHLEPPPDVDITLPAGEPGAPPQTKKEQFAAHTADPSCRSCHVQIDPLGFAFEIYDATGAFATTYANGQTVDATGVMPDGRTFTNANDMLDQIATDQNIAQCYAQRWLEWSLGRSTTREETCAIAAVAQTGSTSVRDAIEQLATSDLMLFSTAAE